MIDIISRGMIEESNGDISQLSEKVNNHTEDSDIHVTTTDKENWNSHPNDVMASGNPVQMDGLQGGVPFSEMVVSGKNLCDYPYFGGESYTSNGVVFTDNHDGSVTANGTATNGIGMYGIWGNAYPKTLPAGTYTISGCPKQGDDNIRYQVIVGTLTSRLATDNGNGATFTIDKPTAIVVRIYILTGKTADNVTFYPQLELGNTATAYEPPITGRELTVNVNGTDYTITPDSNPYTVPNYIRQQEGLNVVSVSEGELSVTGVRKNAAIKRIWDDMGMDLLFDGTVTTGTNCITDNVNGYNFLYFYGNLSSVSGESGNVTGSLVIPKTARAISSGRSLVVTTGAIYLTVNIINIESGAITFTVIPSDSSREIYEFKVFGIK